MGELSSDVEREIDEARRIILQAASIVDCVSNCAHEHYAGTPDILGALDAAVELMIKATDTLDPVSLMRAGERAQAA